VFARRDPHLDILTEVLAGPQSAYGDHMCPAVHSVVWVPGLVHSATQEKAGRCTVFLLFHQRLTRFVRQPIERLYLEDA